MLIFQMVFTAYKEVWQNRADTDIPGFGKTQIGLPIMGTGIGTILYSASSSSPGCYTRCQLPFHLDKTVMTLTEFGNCNFETALTLTWAWLPRALDTDRPNRYDVNL